MCIIMVVWSWWWSYLRVVGIDGGCDCQLVSVGRPTPTPTTPTTVIVVIVVVHRKHPWSTPLVQYLQGMSQVLMS